MHDSNNTSANARPYLFFGFNYFLSVTLAPPNRPRTHITEEPTLRDKTMHNVHAAPRSVLIRSIAAFSSFITVSLPPTSE